MTAKRRGMLIKNTNDRAVTIQMTTREMHMKPGEEMLITAEEVRDAALRESLQFRTVSIVRPSTPEEEAQLRRELDAARASE